MRVVLMFLAVFALAAVAASADQKAPAAKPTTVAKSVATPAAPINLNTATQAQLETLPGVGAKAAERILEYRQKNGNFKKVEDLMNVKGIGEKSFLKLKPLLDRDAEGRSSGDGALVRRSVSMARRLRGSDPGFTIARTAVRASRLPGTLAAIAVPQGLRALDDFRTRAAARYLAQRLGDARLDAIKRSPTHGLRFDCVRCGLPPSRPSSTATPTASARRNCTAAWIKTLTEPERLAWHFPGVSFGICRRRAGRGRRSRPTAPTAFASASAQLLAMNADGTSSSGTLYLRGRGPSQYAVRVLGVTGRVRRPQVRSRPPALDGSMNRHRDSRHEAAGTSPRGERHGRWRARVRPGHRLVVLDLSCARRAGRRPPCPLRPGSRDRRAPGDARHRRGDWSPLA